MALFEMNFGDPQFSGLPRDWAEAKTSVCTESKRTGVAWIVNADNTLLKARGELSDADFADDNKQKEFFTAKGYYGALTLVKMQACKKYLDTKSVLYSSQTNAQKKQMQTEAVTAYFEVAN